MKYMGSKRRIAKQLFQAIVDDLGQQPGRIIEPFIGGANFTSGAISAGFKGEIVAGDLDQDCSYMWQKVLEGWLPTMDEEPNREEYDQMRAEGFSENPLRGFCRITSAFGGVPWGYWVDNSSGKYFDARIGKFLHFWRQGVNSLTKQQAILRSSSVQIVGGSYDQYEEFITDDCVFYFDPPYDSTRGYGSDFDSDAMWQYARDLSERCPVYISELKAPADFTSIRDIEIHHKASNKNLNIVTEKLFRKF